MCGICGVIGKSKDPAISYDLATELFNKTESRGEDASGVWAAEPGDGKILYHKEPIKSTEFTDRDIWKKLKNLDPDLILMHSRAASFGVGSPKINKNNHPFVSADKTAALIHNGRIQDLEYGLLKKQYEVTSECDSEMFLRLFEQGEDPLQGIKDIWSYLYHSQMAIAIGQRVGLERKLWLFRNDYRPIWIADMRDLLGQVFFFSDPDIWDEATSLFINLGKIKLIELPTEVLWCLISNPSGEVSLRKFSISLKGYTPWNHDGKKLTIKKTNSQVKVISRLDENEEPIDDSPKVKNRIWKPPAPRHPELSKDYGGNLFADTSDNKQNLLALANKCQSIQELLNNVETATENLMWENSLTGDDFTEIMTSLLDVSLELEGTLNIINGKKH